MTHDQETGVFAEFINQGSEFVILEIKDFWKNHDENSTRLA